LGIASRGNPGLGYIRNESEIFVNQHWTVHTPLRQHCPVCTIVGIGGTLRQGSSTECALTVALAEASAHGANVRLFDGEALVRLPTYDSESVTRSPLQLDLVEAIRSADGVIIATPAYHGTISGLVKNAIDTLEDLRMDVRPYLHGRAVGCIATAHGWQSGGSTLNALRSVIHALRGWPTPLGVALNVSSRPFDDLRQCRDSQVTWQLSTMARQVVDFAVGSLRITPSSHRQTATVATHTLP
jgi:FMN reductase